MSIILKGIDMPIETDYLRLALFRSGRDNEILVFDDATNTLIGEAIQIPKGHGNIKDENNIDIPPTSVDMFENCGNCNLLDDEQVKEIIANAPTILEAEE